MSDFKIVKLLDPITLNISGPKFVGEYNNTTTYAVGESVSYNGSSYVAFVSTTGNIPTNTSYWQLLASKGDPGSSTNFAVECRNETGSTIPVFKVVYINGATGNKPTINYAQANNAITSDEVIGITAEPIANNSVGTVVSFGVIAGVDTSAWADGTKLYLSASVAGGVTSTIPTQPDHIVSLGIVTRSHASLGEVLINIDVGGHLTSLHDVLITSPATNQVLSYNGTVWINKTTRYVHSQASASATWTVNHNLGYNPTCVVITSGGLQIEPEILHISTNQTIIYMNTSISGTARFT
jgi:hypothetical protein